MKLFLSFLVIFCNLHSLTIKDRFYQAKPGSYICYTLQNSVSCLIFISLENNRLRLYEITTPANLFREGSTLEWINKQKPKASAFLLYEINLDSGRIEKCYSMIQNQYLTIDQHATLLPKLLSCELEKVPLEKRKKKTVKAGEVTSQNALWLPPKIVGGEKQQKRSFEVFSGFWPKDTSELSSKAFTVYFDSDDQEFPYPYWIEIKTSGPSIKLRSLDSGTLDTIPFEEFPAEKLKVLSIDQTKGLSVTLKNHSVKDRYKFLIKIVENGLIETKAIPAEIIENESFVKTFVDLKTLQSLLEIGKAYDIHLISEQNPYDEIFILKRYKLP